VRICTAQLQEVEKEDQDMDDDSELEEWEIGGCI